MASVIIRNRLDPDNPLYARPGVGALLNTGLASTVSVGGATGFVHGSSFLVTGSGFGSKSTAAPLKYDDFQGVTTGAEIVTSTASGPAWSNNGGFAQSINPVASTARLRTGTPFTKNMRSRWLPTGGADPSACSIALTGQAFTVFHLDAWMYNDLSAVTSPGGGVNTNAKHIRLHSVASSAPNLGITDEGSTAYGIAGDGRANYFTPTSTQGQFTGWANPATEIYNTWFHVRWLIDVGSGGAAENGKARIYYNNQLRMTTDVAALLNTGFSNWPEVYIGNYVRSADWVGTQSAYWESLYVDTSWARVEIGNNATYASCTHTEIQIPTNWTSTAVTFTVNRGSFSSGNTVHIFVTDSNNTTQNVGSVVVG